MSAAQESDIRAVEKAPQSAAALELPRWMARPATVLPLILIAVVVVYARGMGDWFVGDDLLLLRAARVVPLPDYVREAFDFRDFEPLLFLAYRPLYFISSAVLYQAFGFNPIPYHVTVLALHLLNIVVLWWIAGRLTSSHGIAYGTAAIFGLHPVYSESVYWISGLNSVAATTAQLVCVAALLKYDERRRPLWLMTALASYAIGLLFHQEIFLAPALFLAYIAVTRSRKPADLVRSGVVTPFILFGAILIGFLAVQGWNSQESGFIDQFAPTAQTLRVACGALSISIYPAAQNSAINARDVILAMAVVASLAGAALAGPRYALLLAYLGAWYIGSLSLSILFFDDLPSSIVKEAIARKIYAAGPALALGMAIVCSAFWEQYVRRAPPALVLVPPAVALVAGLGYSFIRTDRETSPLRAQASDTEAFYHELKHEYTELPEGTRLYAAGVPESLLFWGCPGTTLCYVWNLVTAMYGSGIAVIPISVEQARDPAFLANLDPDDRMFCYRCED